MPKKTLFGKVVSANGNKTIVIVVNRKVQHPLYKKIIQRSKKYHVHDENNNYKIGDMVQIEESKPISKLKKWVVINQTKQESQQ